MEKQAIRVLIAKPGLDGHDRGAKFIVRSLRDAGMEVIYTGLHQRIPEIVRAAIQEDVDVVGMSILSGAYIDLTRKFSAESERQGLGERLILVGGTIPEEDVPKLKALGVDGVFGVETDIDEIIHFIREGVEKLG
ncbi:MAG: methylmalonyl-CoA mutase [Deltaproteobacteria bacterium CG_4_8_14_3_um_filter_45_9]|nr:MAG: methylmalonyl-CoA mutase [Deltaproteobacteria bacterium CG03_land_8_20_14_0_80_45_14]PIX23209.1 MAG: methylmalonyl-CoA mutase [Deltaproteobacteria bacterium CG_4_8_14_3_um_filter_45_9]